MEKVVVDSSVVVKWFVEEAGSQDARKLLRKHENETITLFAPDILILEVMNGLFFKAAFPKNELEGVLEKLFQAELQLISLEEGLVQKTLELVVKERITFYDGLFITLARELECPLITNDNKHHMKKMYKNIRYL
ncbi:type II toxin-antitoxin system VapC family toxin [Candidatus Roizmanbacteria bacterium]|nr:type II toxin-antitoxin system VapC family toxin [Candidatus Roizmanbacteria bacterium]